MKKHTDSLFLDISTKPSTNLLRVYRVDGEPKAIAKKATVLNGQPVTSILEAEDRLLASVPVIQLPPPQENTNMTPENLAAWRVVAYANRGAILVRDRALVAADILLTNPEMAARFKNSATLPPPLSVGRWDRVGLLGILEVYVSDTIAPDEFFVAVKANGRGNAAAAIVTDEVGGLHLVTDLPEDEAPLAIAPDYFARYRF